MFLTRHTNSSYITINADHCDRRVDNFLFFYLKNVPKSLIYKLLRTGKILVNSTRVKVYYRLNLNDQLIIPPILMQKSPSPVVKFNPLIMRQLSKMVLFEDHQLLIVNKPFGLAVHGGSGIRWGIIEAMRLAKPELCSLALVHRLDRDTSGCLLMAKTPQMLRALHQLLKQGGIKKVYSALTLGHWKKNKSIISVPVKKSRGHQNKRVVKVASDGKMAVSEFYCIKKFAKASLMRVALITGRTHQIRVHAQYAGHPIACDSKYGNRHFNKEMQDIGLRRLFLHATSLQFKSPLTQDVIKVRAPLCGSLQNCLEKMLKSQEK